MSITSISSVNNKPQNSPNEQGILVSKIDVGGKQYEVFAVLKDAQGNRLPLPPHFEEKTLHTVDSYVQNLISAHKANDLETKLNSAAIEEITGKGIAFNHGNIISHDPKAQEIWNRIETEIKNDPLLKQDVQGEVSCPVKQQIQLLQNCSSNLESLSDQEWKIYEGFRQKYNLKKAAYAKTPLHSDGKISFPLIEGTFEEYLNHKIGRKKRKLYQMQDAITKPARSLIHRYYLEGTSPSQEEIKTFLTNAQALPIFKQNLFYQYIAEMHDVEEYGVRFIKALEKYINNLN
jgi:hypothetical protein